MLYVCMYICVCVCVYVCMCVYIYTYIYIHTYRSTDGDNRRQYLYFCTSKASKLSTYLFGSGEIGLAEFTSMFNDLITSTKEEMEEMDQVLYIFYKKTEQVLFYFLNMEQVLQILVPNITLLYRRKKYKY